MPDDRTACEKQQYEFAIAEAALEDLGYDLSLEAMNYARKRASRPAPGEGRKVTAPVMTKGAA